MEMETVIAAVMGGISTVSGIVVTASQAKKEHKANLMGQVEQVVDMYKDAFDDMRKRTEENRADLTALNEQHKICEEQNRRCEEQNKATRLEIEAIKKEVSRIKPKR